MHCYACDKEGDFSTDRPTGRVYCSECFQPTIDEQLRLAAQEEEERYEPFIPEEEPVKEITYNHERDYDGWEEDDS